MPLSLMTVKTGLATQLTFRMLLHGLLPSFIWQTYDNNLQKI